MTTSLPPIQMIDSDQSLLRLVERLANEALIAVDTESNSLYAYYERVCLIQISTQTGDWVIDPLALDDLSPLGTIFADPHIEKVFHAAEYDLMCLKRDYEFIFLNLFDTMVTARILGRKAIGLGSLLEDYFDLHMDKRFQKANWSERPLPKDMLRYAQKDTHYLPALRDKLYEELVGRGLLEEALDVFATFAALTPPAASTRHFNPDEVWNMPAARRLNRRQMGALREIAILREEIAQTKDVPPFKVMLDETMVILAESAPQHPRDLSKVRGVTRWISGRYAEDTIAAITRGLNSPPTRRPPPAAQDDALTQTRYNALREWRRKLADARGVESDVIIPKDILLTIARLAPDTREGLAMITTMGAWKRERYGAEIIEVLASVAPPPTPKPKRRRKSTLPKQDT